MSQRIIAPCLLCGKDTITEQRPCVCYDCQEKDISTQDMKMGKAWRENSSLEKWFPFTAEKIKQLESDLNAPRCEVCNSELSDCGEQGVDGTPSQDCKACQLRDKITKLESDLDASNAKLNEAKFKAVCLYCQKMFGYKTGEEQAALADHICSCDMNPLIKARDEAVTLACELYRLVEAYLISPTLECQVHYENLVAWFVRHKTPDGKEPKPVSPEQCADSDGNAP